MFFMKSLPFLARFIVCYWTKTNTASDSTRHSAAIPQLVMLSNKNKIDGAGVMGSDKTWTGLWTGFWTGLRVVNMFAPNIARHVG